VNLVSWGDAARFCNWLQTGTTETGAYTLNGATTDSALLAITRNPGANFVIPTENEWYKAAYYDPNKSGGAGYWDYPTKSNTSPGQAMADVPSNNANCETAPYTWPIDSPYYTTLAGEFQNSASPYGTFDQGGNVEEWNESIVNSLSRGVRGGADCLDSSFLLASDRSNGDFPPAYECNYVGFRVAMVPEPSSLVMLVGIALTALLYWRRKRV